MIKGLYVHVPFCAHNCFYCDFAKALYSEKLADDYLIQLEKELAEVRQTSLVGLYVGGGTPTSLSVSQLDRLLSFLDRFESEEYTVEINPETLNYEKAQVLKRHGVNRVSMGVESFDDELLKKMGRRHTRVDVVKAFETLNQCGIDNISIDLIYGFENQKVKDVVNDLEEAVSLPISHLSVYELEIHEGTFFGKRGYEGSDEDVRYETYVAIREFLKEHGFEHYEVSNFARNGRKSKHNLLYWHFEDFYGAGIGASGKISNIIYENTRRFDRYLTGEWRERETLLSEKEISFERIMMGLRLCESVELSAEESLLYKDAIETNINNGLLVRDENRIRTTERGMELLNDVLVDFLNSV